MSSDYCNQAAIEKVYGSNNVDEWADINGDGDATTKSGRIDEAIDVASEEWDDLFRTMGERIPVVTAAGATPKMVEHVTAVLAGLWLYEWRGAQDYSRDGTPKHGHAWRRDWAYNYMEMVRTGRRKLDTTLGN